MSYKRDMEQLVGRVKKTGARVEQSKRSGHYKVWCPEGLVFLSLTPSAPRAVASALADLRRNGLEL